MKRQNETAEQLSFRANNEDSIPRAKSVTKYTIALVKEGSCHYEAVKGPEAAANIAKSLMLEDAAEEEFWLICLDAKNKPVGLHMVSRGNLNSTTVHPREVFKRAILNNSCSIICMHNHPSGDPTPSGADIETTKRMAEVGELLGITLLDHIIIGDGTHKSLKESMLF
jgi:DNA repair protein RadC